jgi:hypothetical protein
MNKKALLLLGCPEVSVQTGFEATLMKEFSPKTVEKIVESLPIESEVMIWGDELYFDVPVDMNVENAKTSVSKGDIGC